jgi:hypothetical protein
MNGDSYTDGDLHAFAEDYRGAKADMSDAWTAAWFRSTPVEKCWASKRSKRPPGLFTSTPESA